MSSEAEHFLVHVKENDYDRHYVQYVEDGFTTYEAALEYAKKHAKNVSNGRVVCFEATIYQAVRCITVYQHCKSNEYIITEESNF